MGHSRYCLTARGQLSAWLARWQARDALAYTIAYEILVSRLLRRIGRTGPALRSQEMPLGAKLISTIGLTDIVLVRLEAGSAWPLPGIETGGAAALARADGYVIVPSTREGLAPGETVRVSLFAP